MVKLSSGKWGPGSVSIDLSNYFTKGDADERFAFKSHSHDYVPIATFNSHTGDSVKHTTQEEKDKIVAAYNDKHTHTNKANLDTINQALSKSSNVEFNDVLAAGSIAFYGGVGSGSTPAQSLLDLSDIDSTLSTAVVGSPLVKLSNGKWGPGSVSIDLSNYFSKSESDSRFAFKSHSHDYVAPTAFNSHTADMVKHITAAERAAWNAKESALNNPDADGKILASSASGVRSWVNRYILPVAAAAMLGGVMIGSNVNVDAQGRISVAAPYSHPASHPASMITEDSTRRFLTDTERLNWNDAYDKRHTHGNKSNLDSINQNLSQTSNVKFNDVIADGSLAFYGGVGSGSTPVASLLDLSDIDASISAAATGTPLVKLANGKWGAGSVSIDLSNYYNKSDSDARYAFKSHSHDYVTTSIFNGHTHSFASLTSRPTTLAGYNITDAVQHKVGIIPGTDYRHSGYGYNSGGWVTSGAAMTFGASNLYYALLQASGNTLHFNYVFEGNIGTWKQIYHSGNTATIKSDLGLGSNAYTSTAYLPLTSGTLTDSLTIQKSSGDVFTAYKSGATTTYVGTDASGFFITTNGTLRQYFNGSNLNFYGSNLSFSNNIVLHAGNYNSYALPLSGGIVTMSAAGSVVFKKTSNELSIVRYDGLVSSTNTLLGYLGFNSVDNPVYVNAAGNSIKSLYHSGNSNLASIDWSARNLTLAGALSGATTITTYNNTNGGVWSGNSSTDNKFIIGSDAYISGVNTEILGIYCRRADVDIWATGVRAIKIKSTGIDVYGAAAFTSHIQATTAKLTNLTDGYIPYHISDASGLGNSIISQSGSIINIGGALSISGALSGVTSLSAINMANVGGLRVAGNYNLSNGVGLEIFYNNTNQAIYFQNYHRGIDNAYHKIYFGASEYSFDTGLVKITNTNQSTAYTNGALVLSGGLGIAKDLFSNGRAYFASYVESASYIKAAYYKLGNWEIKQNASGELEFILSGALKFKITATGVVSSGEVDFYS